MRFSLPNKKQKKNSVPLSFFRRKKNHPPFMYFLVCVGKRCCRCSNSISATGSSSGFVRFCVCRPVYPIVSLSFRSSCAKKKKKKKNSRLRLFFLMDVFE